MSGRSDGGRGVRVSRIAYRARGQENLYPADGALNLPEEKHSHGMRRLAAIESPRGSFEDAQEAIVRQTGQRLGKRQLRELVSARRVDFESFYEQRRSAQRAEQDDVLVLSCDGKGVVMRPEALREQTNKQAQNAKQKLQTRLSKGEKRAASGWRRSAPCTRSQPGPRTAADILPATSRSGKPGARARGQEQVADGERHRRRRHVVAEMFDEADRRDPEHQRPWVALVDGNNHQIDRIKKEARKRKVKVTILVDCVHVLEYLWDAAWCFFKEGDPAAERWVQEKARASSTARPARSPPRSAARPPAFDLDPKQRKNADACADYLLAKRPYLDYPTALNQGWPIATGVIEGACRHLVKDRMDITGARWGLESAEAVLKLRALTATATSTSTGATTRPRTTPSPRITLRHQVIPKPA